MFKYGKDEGRRLHPIPRFQRSMGARMMWGTEVRTQGYVPSCDSEFRRQT